MVHHSLLRVQNRLQKRPRESDDSHTSTQPPTKRFKPDYSNNLITVLVGSAEKEFLVHQATICRNSPFFEAACSREWKEGQDRVVRLPEVEVQAFDVYVHWAYTGEIDMSLMPEPKGTRRPPSYLDLGKIWCLAHYLQNDQLCNSVIDRILVKLNGTSRGVRGSSMQWVLDNTSTDSGLQRLLLDTESSRVTEKYFEKRHDRYPRAVIFEFAKRFAAGKVPQRPGPTYEDRCRYHTHKEGEGECI
ncbi:hypothetical protein LTR37_012250 [Vermiconidia calcicola]|uniref:Uncharacterized protein n=1 Tax=Vermiconidia calcicola TaxID=1690605 RepID=A0ACC3MZW8_9PEZI|nr:hypothetical protein LTR37_012250 [Vermiconidia calcicola]